MRKVLLAVLALFMSVSCAYADGGDKREKEAKVTREEAKEIALRQLPGGTVVDVDLEKKKGKLFWQVEIKSQDAKTKKEVKIDASSGEVLKVKEDTDD